MSPQALNELRPALGIIVFTKLGQSKAARKRLLLVALIVRAPAI